MVICPKSKALQYFRDCNVFYSAVRLDVTTSSDSQTSATDEPSCSTPNTTTTSHTSPSDGALSPAKFAHAGVFVTDDHISIDITQQQQQPPQTPTIVKPVNRHPPRLFDEVPIKPLVDTHIPRSSPMPARRKSIDSTSALGGPQQTAASQSAAAGGLTRKIPAYRSMRKPASTAKATASGHASASAIKDKAPAAGHTWSGRTSVAVPKKRATLGPDTFSAINRPGSAASNTNGDTGTGNHEHIGSGFNRNSAVRASQTLYDRNGRRVKSTNTSPTKSVSPSPLAQQILEAAGTARNDSQMLEKMKRLLSRYTTNGGGGGGAGPDAAAATVDDFTTAWVNSNGTLDRVGSSSSCSGSPIKMQSKRSSAASSVDSAQSRELAALAAAAAAPRPNRGTSRIPAPIRQNTVLY